jgi:hypothetical protein
MDDFKFYIRHNLPGRDEPEYRGVPYHSEEMARSAFEAATRVWSEFDIDLLDDKNKVILHYDARDFNDTKTET